MFYPLSFLLFIYISASFLCILSDTLFFHSSVPYHSPSILIIFSFKHSELFFSLLEHPLCFFKFTPLSIALNFIFSFFYTHITFNFRSIFIRLSNNIILLSKSLSKSHSVIFNICSFSMLPLFSLILQHTPLTCLFL